MEQVAVIFHTASRWLGIPPDITLWELLNSELIAAFIIGIFGLFLGRKVNRLSEKAEDIATAGAYARELDDLEAAEDNAAREVQAIEPPAASPRTAPEASGPQPVETRASRIEDAEAEEEASGSNTLQADASYIVNDAKKLVDERLATQKDGRKLRRYENIGKRDYRLRTLAARDDGLLTNTQALNLLEIFEIWRPYGTGRKIVTADVIQNMRSHLEAAKREKISARASRRKESKRDEGA